MTKPNTKSKQSKKSRHTDRFTSRQYQPYALAIGQAALAWNALHEALGALFEHLIGGYDEKVMAAWQSVFSDRAKRGMLKAAIGEMDWKDKRRNPKAEEELKWLFGQLDRLEDVRNDVVHAPLASFDDPVWQIVGRRAGIQPDDVRGNRRAANLHNRDLLTEYRYCRDAAAAYADYVDAIQWAWRWRDDDIDPWPERPQLPNRGQKSRAKAQTGHSPKQLPLLPESSQG